MVKDAFVKVARPRGLGVVGAGLVLLFLVGYSLPPAPVDRQLDENGQLLQRISAAVSAIAQRANKSIVFVSISKAVQGTPFGMIDPFEFFFGPGFRHGPDGRGGSPAPQQMPKQRGLGSGFIVDLDKGYVITNNHVVEGADEISLKLANDSTYDGRVVGRDKNTDVAVVQIKDAKFKRDGLDVLALGDSDRANIGDFVIALGAPFGLEASVSFGVISAIGRGNLDITQIGNFIQTDAAINPGNSGGPLLDVKGDVVGMNTAIYSRSGAYNGIGFAIPSKIVRSIADQLINSGKIHRGFLGVQLGDLDEDIAAGLKLPKGQKGALIGSTNDGGPAAKAGLEAGDVIVEVNGKSVSSGREVATAVGLLRPGTQVAITYLRNGDRKTAQVTLQQHPDDDAEGSSEGDDRGGGGGKLDDSYGMALTDITPNLRQKFKIESKRGAVVVEVAPGSIADQKAIEPGDVIISEHAGGGRARLIDSADQFRSIAKGAKGRRLLVRIERQGRYRFVNLAR